MWDKSFSVVLTALVVTGCAAHTVTSGRVVVRDDRAAVELHFSDRDRALIAEHYRVTKPKKAPPGLAKRDSLPRAIGAAPVSLLMAPAAREAEAAAITA